MMQEGLSENLSTIIIQNAFTVQSDTLLRKINWKDENKRYLLTVIENLLSLVIEERKEERRPEYQQYVRPVKAAKHPKGLALIAAENILCQRGIENPLY